MTTKWVTIHPDLGDDRYVNCMEMSEDGRALGLARRPFKQCDDCKHRTVDWTSLPIKGGLLTVCMVCKEARRAKR